MVRIYKYALESYYKLKKIVDNFKGTLEELCDELGGHNFEDDLFDINFEWICGTVVKINDHLELVESIEIWNDKNYEFVGDFYVDWLEKQVGGK